MKRPGLRSDMEFVRSVVAAVRRHVAEPDFCTTTLAAEMGYSRMHVNRRIRATLGCSTGDLIRLVRMQHARRLLEQCDLTASGVAHVVGFRSASHFSRLFRDTWGISPADLRKQIRHYSDIHAGYLTQDRRTAQQIDNREPIP